MMAADAAGLLADRELVLDAARKDRKVMLAAAAYAGDAIEEREVV